MAERQLGSIPIAAARKLGKEYDCPVVVIFALHPRPENRFTVTTYGHTRMLCKLAADYAEKIARGIELGEIAPSEVEPEGLPERPAVWDRTRSEA